MGSKLGRSKRMPVVVLGRGLTVLGVIRALGREGVRSYCLELQQMYVARSRWHRAIESGAPPAESQSLDLVLAKLPLERAVVIPCTDNWVRAVANLPPEVASKFPSSVPPASAVELFIDKRNFHTLLKAQEIPHPLTVELKSESDLSADNIAHLEHGFLKPCDSQAFGTLFRRKAFTFDSRDEALARYREATQAGLAVIMQEYIPGPPTEHFFLDGFVDREGRFKAWFARRRLRMHPMPFGNSTYLVSVGLEEVSDGMQSLEKLLTATRYRGIFSAEFKRDQRDGRLKLLEINARPWWYVGFAVDCGVNVVHMAYLDALKMEVPEKVNYPNGVHFVFTAYDGMACRMLHEAGKLSKADWFRQWATAKQALFVWYDPWPSTRAWIIRISRAIVRRVLRRPPSPV